MTKRVDTYTSITARVTPETERALVAYHTDRLERGGTPRTFTASLREVIEAGLRALGADRDRKTASSNR